jgi:hypothetical protein
VLDHLLQPLPPDTPEKRIIDPKTGVPVPYGYYAEIMRYGIISTTGEKTVYSDAIIAVRNLGIVQVNDGYSAIGFELPISQDRSIVLILTVNSESGSSLTLFKPDDIMNFHSARELNHSNWIPGDISGQFIQSIRGQQVLIEMYHNIPDVKCKGLEDALRACNRGDQVLQFINNPTIAVPEIPAWERNGDRSLIIPTVILPYSLVLSSPIFKKFFSK